MSLVAGSSSAPGGAVGMRVVANDELCENIDSSDEWIYSRTGI
ncbi:hypothetical protein, partial [Mycobacterium sp. E2462]